MTNGLIIKYNYHMFSETKTSEYLSLSIDNLWCIDDWPIIDNRQSDTWCILEGKCDCLDRLCNFVTIINDLGYFNSHTLPKIG